MNNALLSPARPGAVRRLAAGTAVSALLLLPAAALGFGPAPAAVTIADHVTVVLETKDGPVASGPLDAEPFTYTAVSRVACEAPYLDGARVVLTQDAEPQRVVISGIEKLESDGTARIGVDAVLADMAADGESTLLVECVKVSDGIVQPAPKPIAQEIQVGAGTWRMEGVTEAPEEEPTEPAPTEEPTADPTAEPTGEPTAEPTGEPSSKPSGGPSDKPAPGGDGDAGSGDGQGEREPLGRTGVQVTGALVAAAALIGGGLWLRRRA